MLFFFWTLKSLFQSILPLVPSLKKYCLTEALNVRASKIVEQQFLGRYEDGSKAKSGKVLLVILKSFLSFDRSWMLFFLKRNSKEGSNKRKNEKK